MRRFISFTNVADNNNPIYLNPKSITCIRPCGDRTVIYFIGDMGRQSPLTVVEPIEEVLQALEEVD